MVGEQSTVPRLLIAVVCLSLIAVANTSSDAAAPARPSVTSVVVTNAASNPVPTQNVGGAATQVGQPASKLVNLFCSTSSPLGTCGFSVPTGEALVVTDWEWICISTIGQGNYDGPNLFANPGGNVLLSDSALVDGRQVVRGKDHLTSGVVAPAGSSPAVGSATNGCSAAVQGYLVPNQ